MILLYNQKTRNFRKLILKGATEIARKITCRVGFS